MEVHIGPYEIGIGVENRRKVDIKIEDYDLWNLNTTLAIIILPALKKFNGTKQGAPHVDDEDVPVELRRGHQDIPDHEADDKWFDRYQYVLDEMIFAFERVVDDSWEDKYHTGNIDFEFIRTDDEEELYEMVKTDKDTHKFDAEGCKKEADRIQNGLRLFGKYYQSLWN